ncbi:hypothetical protein D3C71_25200 [compost metagenome]
MVDNPLPQESATAMLPEKLSLRPLPEDVAALVATIVEKAREDVERGQSPGTLAVVANLSSHETLGISMDSSSTEASERSARHVRQVAAMMEADFVVVVSRSWGLPANKVHQYGAIMERYGSVAESPYRVDQMAFAVETFDGVWLGTAPIVKHSRKRTVRTFGEVRFIGRDHTEALGTLTALLPSRRTTQH